MNFFKLYIGDYQRDTGTLTLAEHGAYLLMLQHLYATEKPLPIGRELHRLLRAETASDRKSIDTVASRFFFEADGGLVNGRALDEIRKGCAQREINREIGKRGGRPKGSGNKTDSVIDSVSDFKPNEEPNRNPNQTPDTRLKEKEPPKPPAAVAAGFSEFWSAWPRKVGKAQAEKAWSKLHPSDDLVTAILRAIAAQSRSPQWIKDGGQFIPHPATWLNGRRWEDETSAKPQAPGLFAGVRVDNMETA